MIIDFNRYNGGGGSSSAVTPEQVQQQINSALTPYWDSAATEDAISAATSGKADAASVTPNDFMCFPKWNAQGIITGTTGNNLSRTGFYLNGTVRYLIKDLMSGDLGDLYGPTTPGTAGQILVSAGNGAPVWSAMPAADVTKAYVDSAVTELQDQVDTMDEVVSAALVDLNDKVGEISGNTGGGTDLSNYWNSAQTENAISAATSGKADAANVTENQSNLIFPKWNQQGVITGNISQAFRREQKINGTKYYIAGFGASGPLPTYYAPTTSGNPGEILVSTGNGAPIWKNDNKVSSTSVSTIWKGTQAEYDAIATKDPATLYIIL